MKKIFSIIILYHSNKAYLDWALDSIVSSVDLNSVEILVVVNNSNKLEYEVTIDHKDLKIIRINENLGYAKAANIGAAEANGEFLVFCDHDLVFEKNWLNNLFDYYNTSSNLGAVSCKILNTHTKRILDFGIAFSEFNSPHPFMDLPFNHPLVSENQIFQAICTGGYLIKKEVFNDLEGFDEKLGSMYTDIDLCLRLKELNLKCGVTHNAYAYHFGGDFSVIERGYKDSTIKTDIKGYFMRKNAHLIEEDMHLYYEISKKYFLSEYNTKQNKYLACNLMNVADPQWYESQVGDIFDICDRYERPSKNRDGYTTPLFECLGYDIMKQSIPLIYFVDRFTSLEKNRLWWDNRALSNKNDIVVDRNGNILPVSEISR